MARNVNSDALIHCESCGEDYSATYKRCPFCGDRNGTPIRSSEEDHAAPQPYVFDGQDVFDQPDEPQEEAARGGKRLAGGNPPPPINWSRLITFLCALVIIAAALVIVFTWVYPKLRDKTGDNNPQSSPITSVQPSQTPQASQEPDSSAQPDPDSSEQPQGDGLTSLTMSSTDFTLEAGKTHTITLTYDPQDWTGDVTWSSSDETCATVDANGKVTNVNTSGTQRRAIITATAGGQTVEATVYCRSGSASSNQGSSQGNIPDGSKGVIANASDGLRIRSGPGTDNSVLASVKNGTEITVNSYAGDGWYSITFPGPNGAMDGYIMGEYISVN